MTTEETLESLLGPSPKQPPMNIEASLAGCGHEIALMIDSRKGYCGCRVKYEPEDIDHLICNLLDIKAAWIEERKGHTVAR